MLSGSVLTSLTLAILFFLSGCSTMIKTPGLNMKEKSDSTKDANVKVEGSVALANYTKVLASHVNDKGEVNFLDISKDLSDLESYIYYIAKTPLSEFKSENELLAHYINSYNALSIYTVIKRNFPKTHAGLNKVRFFYLTKMQIGLKKMSLYKYENDFIRALGEERIHFALNCMARSCPLLPKKPFTAENIKAELEAATKYFFSESRNLKIDHQKKIAYVSEILSFFTKDFTPKHAPSLLDYINKYSPEKIPSDYKIKFIDYDWTVLAQNL